MSIKVIQRMKKYCYDLLVALKKNDTNQITVWLDELEKENNEELAIAREFKIKYLLSLHGMVAKQTNQIRRNLINPNECIVSVNTILKSLENVVDQREVRDDIIKKVIHPIFKKWGYKKKGRSFVKKEENYSKKLSIFTSQSCDYYDVRFIFEIDITGPGTNYMGHRINGRWFELNQDMDLERIKVEIQAHLITEIKPFLEQFK